MNVCIASLKHEDIPPIISARVDRYLCAHADQRARVQLTKNLKITFFDSPPALIQKWVWMAVRAAALQFWGVLGCCQPPHWCPKLELNQFLPLADKYDRPEVTSGMAS